MTKPQFALIPSAYRDSRIYSVLPVDGSGDMTFYRAAEVTRVREDGLMENVSSLIPRLNWLNSNCPSLLLEPQRTNLALYSENFEGTNWSAGNTVVTQNDSIAPSGEQTAVKLQRTTTSASYRTHFIYKSNSAITYTTSVFVKQGENNFFAMRSQGSFPSRVDIRFRFDTGLIYYAQAISGFTLIDYDVENYSNGWYRIYYTYTSDTHSNLSITFSPRETDGNIDGSDISSNSFAYVWGFQTEVGNYLTSYIYTSNFQTTRDADLTYGAFSTYNSNEGALFLDVKAFNNDGSSVIRLGDNGANIMSFNFSTNNNLFILINNVYSSPITSYTYIHDGERQKYAIKWIGDNYYIYINGLLVISAINTGRTFSSLTSFNFTANNGFSNFQGEVYNAQIFDTALSNDEIINLTK